MSVTMVLALCLLLLVGGQQPVHGPEKAPLASVIAGGERGEGTRPFVLGFGGASDPYVIALAYPPEVRLAAAAYAAKRRGQRLDAQQVSSSFTAPLVYVVVESREKMSALARREKAKPERLLILPKPESLLSEGKDGEVVEDPSTVLPDIPGEFDGRVFAVPAEDWRERGYLVIFEEQALSTGGESGRERRCWVYDPVR